jgi:hypothetical protein
MATMKKFEASGPSVQVNGETILAFINANKSFKDSVLKILSECGIKDPQPGSWYSQQSWLNAFKKLGEKPAMLRMIGKEIPKSAKFPPEIKDLIGACQMLDKAYKINHRGGLIGEYKFVSGDLAKKIIVMDCDTPYPEEFDKGILMGLCEKYIKNFNGVPSIHVQGIRFTMKW